MPRSAPSFDASRAAIEFTDERLTAHAGTRFLAEAARRLHLAERLAGHVHVKQRKRGCDDAEMLLALIHSLAVGDGCLCDVRRLAADEARRQLAGLPRVPDHRRLGEYLARFTPDAIDGLHQVAREIAFLLWPLVIPTVCGAGGHVPVFLDGSAIEVSGQHFEGANVGYNGKPQLWLHSIFVGPLWVSQRLNPGGGSVIAGWREQLERDLVPIVPAGTPLWFRMDNAYYDGEVIAYLAAHGWDYSVSVTHPVYQAPLERLAAGLPEACWKPLGEEGREQVAWVRHQPEGWAAAQTYVVIRRFHDRHGQKMLVPRYSFVLTSLADWPAEEVVAGHRGKQGDENYQKAPLIELDLHHPPCRSLAANRAVYTAGQIALFLLLALQHAGLPPAARHDGVRTILRDAIRVAGKLVRASGRRMVLKLAKTALRLDWLRALMDWADPHPAST